MLVKVHHEDVAEQLRREPPDGRHVGEGAGYLLVQSFAFALELFDGAAGVGDDLSQLSLGSFDLAVEVGARRGCLVEETAGIGERGGCRRLTCEWLKGHGGKMKGGEGESGKKGQKETRREMACAG
jgi:hypothetical protein